MSNNPGPSTSSVVNEFNLTTANATYPLALTAHAAAHAAMVGLNVTARDANGYPTAMAADGITYTSIVNDASGAVQSFTADGTAYTVTYADTATGSRPASVVAA